ncbi:MAG: DJ-1/PfpI family protein [Theionarchaea archaeon]|nr:DJ-1/PfpI family protein [Theionarchaea archaeon]
MVEKLLTIVYPGFAEWEVVFPLFCVYPAIEYQFCTVKEKQVRSAMGFEIEAMWTLTDVNPEDFEGVYLPGGIDPVEQHFPRKLGENQELLSLLQRAADHGKVVAALCGALLVLGAAGLLHGKRFVCDITEDTRGWLDTGHHVDNLCVVDHCILTRSVRGLIPFSYTSARLLGEEETAQEIKDVFTSQMGGIE